MRSPMARSATIEPMLPQPMMPRTLPVSSTPMKRFFSHFPAWVEVSACGIWRASAKIIAIACSAVVIEFPKGVFMTITPRAVAAGISTLSTPIPARPITFRFLARSRIFAVTLVAERTASPSYSPMASASLSLSLPRSGWKSTVDAAILEDLHGRGRKGIGNENAGLRHGSDLDRRMAGLVPAIHVAGRNHGYGEKSVGSAGRARG